MSYSSWISHGPGRKQNCLQKDLTKESSRKDWLTQVWAELRGQSRMLRSLGINHSGKAEERKGKKKRIRIWERWSHRGEAIIVRGTALQQGKWGRNILAFSPLTSWSLAGASHWLPLTRRQPCHPLSSPSPPAFNLSQDQGLFKWVSSSHQVAKVLEFHHEKWCHPWTTWDVSGDPFLRRTRDLTPEQTQQGPCYLSQIFLSGVQTIGVSASTSVLSMNTEDWFPLGWTGWISLQSKGLLRVFSNTTIQKHQFFGAQLSLLSHLYMTTGKA